MDGQIEDAEPEDLSVGAQIEVRNRFHVSWSRGYEVADSTRGVYWVRRLSDGSVLPVQFGADDVRRVS